MRYPKVNYFDDGTIMCPEKIGWFNITMYYPLMMNYIGNIYLVSLGGIIEWWLTILESKDNISNYPSGLLNG